MIIYFLYGIGLSLLMDLIHAYPNGAGGCDAGKPAVGGGHLSTNAVTGTLADGGFELVIVGDQYGMRVGYTIYFGNSVSLKGGPFRGILIRMEGAVRMDPETNFQSAIVCENDGAVGITHTENSNKSGSTSIGRFTFSYNIDNPYIPGDNPTLTPTDPREGISIDVTVVVSNSADLGSEYYYNSYKWDSSIGNWTVSSTPELTIPPTTIEVTAPPTDLTVATIGPSKSSTPATISPSEAAGTEPPTLATMGPSEEKVTQSPAFSPTDKEPFDSTIAPTDAPSKIVQQSKNSSPISSGSLTAIVFAFVFLICFLVGSFLYYKKMQQSTSSRRPDNSGVTSSHTAETVVANEINSEMDKPAERNTNDGRAPHHDVAEVHPNVPQFKDQTRSVVKPPFGLVDEGGVEEEIPVVSAKLADVTLDEEEDAKPQFRLDP